MEATGSIWMRPQKRHSRGPDPTYSRDQITKAAIAIADAEGLEAVSMRRVAREVGAGAMSLYRYLDSKEDLFVLMADAVAGEDPTPDTPSGDWRADLTYLARRQRAIMHRHPWLAAMAATRPTFGPNMLRSGEFSLACVNNLGLSIDKMLTITTSVLGFVQGFVQTELAEAEASRRTNMTEEQWRRSQAPYIGQIMDSGKYPLITKVILDATIPHMDPDQQFQNSLDHLLDGISAQLDRRS